MSPENRDLIIKALLESKAQIEAQNNGNCLQSVLQAIQVMAQEVFVARHKEEAKKKDGFELVD